MTTLQEAGQEWMDALKPAIPGIGVRIECRIPLDDKQITWDMIQDVLETCREIGTAEVWDCKSNPAEIRDVARNALK